MAIFVVLAVVFLLAFLAGVVTIFTSSAFREVDVLHGYLRAVSIGECAFSELLARLSTVPWCRRWFKGAPDLKYNLSLGDGSYSYLLRDTASGAPPTPGIPDGKRADLLIRATSGNSTVAMFWRLTFVEDSLEGVRRIVPELYTFAGDPARVDPAGQDLLSGKVDDMVRLRSRNSARFRPVIDQVRGGVAPAQTAMLLGVDPKGSTVDPTNPVEDPAPPPDLPSDLVTPPPPTVSDVQVHLSYVNGADLGTSVVKGQDRGNGKVSYLIMSRMNSYLEKQAQAEITLPDPGQIESVSVELTAYNDDSQYMRTLQFFVNGEGGAIGSYGITNPMGNLRGSGVMSAKGNGSDQTSLSADMSSVQIGLQMSSASDPDHKTMSLLSHFQSSGPVKIVSYVDAQQGYGQGSWVSFNLIIQRK